MLMLKRKKKSAPVLNADFITIAVSTEITAYLLAGGVA
jgi:hypothetical protein